MRDAFRMPGRVSDRLGAALRQSEQDKPLETCGIDHRFQVLHKLVEIDVDTFALRHTDATGVVAEHGVMVGQRKDSVPQHLTFKIMLEMREPVRGADEFWAFADDRVGEPYAVWRCAVLDGLLHAASGANEPAYLSLRRSF